MSPFPQEELEQRLKTRPNLSVSIMKCCKLGMRLRVQRLKMMAHSFRSTSLHGANEVSRPQPKSNGNCFTHASRTLGHHGSDSKTELSPTCSQTRSLVLLGTRPSSSSGLHLPLGLAFHPLYFPGWVFISRFPCRNPR